jgi:hypothetical protein
MHPLPSARTRGSLSCHVSTHFRDPRRQHAQRTGSTQLNGLSLRRAGNASREAGTSRFSSG